MRKATVIFIILLLSCPMARGQKSHEQLGGVYYAYPVTTAQPQEQPPSGYEPFYLSHYGRHGSRWLPHDERYEWVISQFEDASNLTRLGRQVRGKLRKIWKNARGNGGKLTPLGARQHRGIALRMMDRYPQLFTGNAVVKARSSTVDRCRKSMLAFTDAVRERYPQLKMSVETRAEDMAYLVNNTKEVKELERRVRVTPCLSADRFMQSLFKDPSRVFPSDALRQSQSLKLLSELFTIATDMQDVEMKIDLFNVFTEEEMLAVYHANNHRMTLCNGNHPESEGIPARAAISLWENIVEEADAAIESADRKGDSGMGASLRFGHDTNLYRLLSLLQAVVPASREDGLYADRSPWDQMDELLPMAANLQMVFYHRKDGDVLVQLFHNERVIKLPLAAFSEGAGGIYYRWNDLKTAIAERIHALEHLRQLCALNTMVGTAQANTRTAGLFGKGSEEHGQTLPAVLVPNGQNFWTPQTQDTEQKCIAPYYYKDTLMQGFRNSHWIVGGCTQDYGSFTVAVLSDRLRTSPAQRATRFDHAGETSHPHYYAVRLPDEHLSAELTASSHAAMLRVTPDRDGLVHIVIQPNSDEGQGYVEIDTLHRLVYGYNPVHRIYQGWGEPAGFSGHFVLSYGDELLDFGTFEGEKRHPHATSIRQQPSPSDLTATHHPEIAEPAGAYLTFRGKAARRLLLSAASSFTSREGALGNLSRETSQGQMSFDEMVDSAAKEWIKRFHAIDVEDDDTVRVNQFYGAFYRASFLPRELSDADGRYPGFAGNGLSATTGKQYTDFSMWDTYRAVHPLYNIIAPHTSGEMMQSLVNMYREGGWLPIFPCWNSYTAAMIGDHCSVVLSDAYVKGIRNFDYQQAYEGMRKNAFETPAGFHDYQNGMGRRALTSYLRYGFIPLEDPVKEAFHTEEQTSRTLEYAFDDFAVAQMAKALGREDDYQKLMKRADNWRNVINPLTGWADGRHADGRWENNLDVVHRKSYITEGATCHYTWYVPHDTKGLLSVLPPTAVERLDSMFTEGRYWHGNEPCHQVAYLFNDFGRPDLTQKWVRHILETEYNDTAGGLSGNDDAGQMSAWYLFSAMGFYPVCPATPVYQIGSPMFSKVRLNLENGRTFTIEAENASKENIYIDKMELNGIPYSQFSLPHDEMMKGGKLKVVMRNETTK